MNDDFDKFLSIDNFPSIQLKVMGSKFIARAFSVKDEEDAKKFIEQTKKKFFDATHHCFAYRIKSNDQILAKLSNAQEPKGTAGEHILSAIKSKNLYDILIVVTRYFGGTKLGKGGLSRAYHQSAKDVLEKCRIVEKFLSDEYSIIFPMNLVGKVSQILDKFDVEVLERDLKSEGHVKIRIRSSQSQKLKKALIEATGGQIKFE